MKVLITGGTGFIGRYLSNILRNHNASIRIAVRKVSPHNHLSAETIQVGDIGSKTDWKNALDGIDYVVHLAALAHQIGKKVPASRFDQVNHLATAQLATAVATSGTVKRLVFVSSIGAVCSMSHEPVKASTPCQPDSDYGRSKLAAEREISRILAGTAADWTILRPTLVYGPGNPGNMLRLLQLVRTGLPLPLGAIRNRRSFLYVGNLADVILGALTHPRASRQIFNVSDNEVLSTPQLIRAIAGVSNKKARLLPFPTAGLKLAGWLGDGVSKLSGRSIGIDSYSVERLLGSLEVDNSELREALGWSPPFTAQQGLAQTLQPAAS